MKSFILQIIFLFFSFFLFSEAQELYEKQYFVEQKSVLNVINKNGTINIETWKKDYIEVTAKKYHQYSQVIK